MSGLTTVNTKIATGTKQTIYFRLACHGGWREMPPNLF